MKSFLRANLEFKSKRAPEHTKDRITSNSGNKICLHLACAHRGGASPIVSVFTRGGAFVLGDGLHGLRRMGRAMRRVRLTLRGRPHGLLLGLAGPVPHVDGSAVVFACGKGSSLKVSCITSWNVEFLQTGDDQNP